MVRDGAQELAPQSHTNAPAGAASNMMITLCNMMTLRMMNGGGRSTGDLVGLNLSSQHRASTRSPPLDTDPKLFRMERRQLMDRHAAHPVSQERAGAADIRQAMTVPLESRYGADSAAAIVAARLIDGSDVAVRGQRALV